MRGWLGPAEQAGKEHILEKHVVFGAQRLRVQDWQSE